MNKPVEQLVKVCEEFIRKVESGEARSVRTYNDMKAALAAVKAVPLTPEQNCSNCLHQALDSDREPCNSCENFNKWQPKL